MELFETGLRSQNIKHSHGCFNHTEQQQQNVVSGFKSTYHTAVGNSPLNRAGTGTYNLLFF